MNASHSMVAVAIALIASSADAQQSDTPVGVTFGLRVTALHSDQRVELSSANSGRIPILTPGWSCAWSKTPQQLIVECFPRDDSQGVTIRAWCPEGVRTGEVSMMHLSTHDDADSNPATEIIASCYSK